MKLAWSGDNKIVYKPESPVWLSLYVGWRATVGSMQESAMI